MLLPIDQVVAEGGQIVSLRDVSTVEAPPRLKWLNIVLDLNGILCQSAARSTAKDLIPSGKFANRLAVLSPAIVGYKAVLPRPRLREFLQEISGIANRIVVWSSMAKKNAEDVAGHLFLGCRPPFDILAQEHCRKIEISRGKFLPHLDYPRKPLFLKILEDQLFSNPSETTSFNRDNTLLIDDSCEKSVCNERRNAIFLNSWTAGELDDDVLMGTLVPWLRQLHMDCIPGGLRDYVERNRIGHPPLPLNSRLHSYIVDGMRESAKNMGSRFELRGENYVIDSNTRSP